MIHFIAKPQTKKKGLKLMRAVEDRMKAEGREYLVHYTQSKDDGMRIARELTERGENCLVVVGGDGTLNNVLAGIADPAACTLGLIPAGTGNDFAAAAHIPYGLPALDLILKGEPKPTDFIDFSDGRRSINIAGLGIDVDILTRCENMKHFHAKTKYYISLIASLCKFNGFEMDVTLNGETKRYNALIAAVCNGKQLGGGIPLCPPADVGDGKLDFMIVDNPKRYKLLGALLKLVRGKVLSVPFAHHTLCESVTIRPLVPHVAQYDGELYMAEALEAVIVKGRLKFFRA